MKAKRPLRRKIENKFSQDKIFIETKIFMINVPFYGQNICFR